MGNLSLNFPDLQPSSFEPWMDEAAARKEGKTFSGHAADRPRCGGVETLDVSVEKKTFGS